METSADPEWTLLYYLREKLRLCGTKLGCGEGGCGACTVMVSKYDRASNKIHHSSVNACLAPICSMHGLAVTTVEGIGSTKTKLHTIQERMAKMHASQCGFCTPGKSFRFVQTRLCNGSLTLKRTSTYAHLNELNSRCCCRLCEGFISQVPNCSQNGKKISFGAQICSLTNQNGSRRKTWSDGLIFLQ